MEDFVTWVDTSKIRQHVLEYRDLRDDYDIHCWGWRHWEEINFLHYFQKCLMMSRMGEDEEEAAVDQPERFDLELELVRWVKVGQGRATGGGAWEFKYEMLIRKKKIKKLSQDFFLYT